MSILIDSCDAKNKTHSMGQNIFRSTNLMFQKTKSATDRSQESDKNGLVLAATRMLQQQQNNLKKEFAVPFVRYQQSE